MTSNLDIDRLIELRGLVDDLILELKVIEHLEKTGKDNDYYEEIIEEIIKAHNDNIQLYKHYILNEVERKE